MADHTERWTLNRLIATCRDGERGFRYAANHVRDSTVKALFLEIAGQREQFAADILTQAQRLGGATESDGSFAGALHRGWMTLKDAVGGHEDAAIIREADRGERSALAAYEEALDGMLPPAAREVIERQCAEVRHSHNRVHALLVSVPSV
ncbi:MAG TPA: PA2169 family four-helix-bundle protein [Vicinamibacterales bacterium]|nr:PA2169 family four-helix-bundle protein [Vicinamibacterales bacterium]